jgi:hypothetical protein
MKETTHRMDAEKTRSMAVFSILTGSVIPGKRPKIAISKPISMAMPARMRVTIQSLDRSGHVLRGSTWRHQVNGLSMRVTKAQAGRKKKA